jgi:hypothetical protein
MTSMPIIDDRTVDLFRRTGKRRASYRPAQGGRAAAAAQRVVLQRDSDCFQPGQSCDCDATGRCAGRCNSQLTCVVDPFGPNGGGPFDL